VHFEDEAHKHNFTSRQIKIDIKSYVFSTGPLKGKNPNPLNGTRVAAVVKDSDAGAPEGPVTVGKRGNPKGAYHYLCEKYTSGSLNERATNIAAHLNYLASNDGVYSQWFVFLWKTSEGWATRSEKGHSFSMKNECGHDMWVFSKQDKYYDRTSCSSKEKAQAETIIRGAASPGGSYSAVRDRITQEFAASDVNLLFTVVGGYNDNWNYGQAGHYSCGDWVDIKTSDTGDDYQVYYFLKKRRNFTQI